MERKKLVRIESISMIVITLGIFFLIFNLYFIIKGMSRDILYVNNKNRESVKKLFEKSEQYKEVKDFDQIKKIQYFLAFNNMEFTIYYKDGSTSGNAKMAANFESGATYEVVIKVTDDNIDAPKLTITITKQ